MANYEGITREAAKEAVKKKLQIGKRYLINSAHKDQEDGNLSKVKLTEFSTFVAVFKHKNGTRESFTYPELYRQLLAGELR